MLVNTFEHERYRDNVQRECEAAPTCAHDASSPSVQEDRHGSLPKTIVARSEMNAGGGTVGLGLFVAQDVTQGQEIDAYTGDVRNTEQMEQVLRRRGTDAPRYDIELKPLPNTYRDGPLFIDAYSTGNKSRFINHSCDANCRFRSGSERACLSSRWWPSRTSPQAQN